jgi:hypothetical protein
MLLSHATDKKNDAKHSEADNLMSSLISPNADSCRASDSRRELTTQGLYGGAISIQIPASFQDVSTIREVRYVDIPLLLSEDIYVKYE